MNPNIYDDKSQNPGGSPFYYNIVLSIVLDLLKDAVINVDKKNIIINEISKFIKNWPIKYRKKIEHILIKLKKNNRFCQINKNYKESILDLQTEDTKAVISVDEDEEPGSENIYFGQYPMSKFSLRDNNSHIINEQTYDRYDLDNLILKPVFKYAKNIKIIDRYIGSHISQHPGEMNIAYKEGLSYMFKSLSKGKNIKNVDIYTAINIWKPAYLLTFAEKNKIDNSIKDIVNFLSELKKLYRINISFIYSFDKKEFIHDRYLITDQIGLFFGRGFDIFNVDGSLRDNTVGIIDNEDVKSLSSELIKINNRVEI